MRRAAEAATGPAAVRQATTTLKIDTRRQGLLEITPRVREWVAAQTMRHGVLTVYCRHTSASLLIQENAAREVAQDLEQYFARIAPESATDYAHQDEGPDDMPGHLRTALTAVSVAIPLVAGDLALGTWQGIFLFEHRRRAHRREIVLHLIGE
jgi:secondary thiamine-phosphate synthase enzyme